ncbi:MAG: creatininase family protein [Terrimicrobiaceae bacterium]
MSNNAILWENLAWPDIPRTLACCAKSVLWPFGATEQHGPHLALGTDSFIATAVCLRVSERTRVPVLPTFCIGMSAGHSKKWPGTLSLKPSTLALVVRETGEWLHAAGVRRLFLINSHVTNAAPLRCGLEELRTAYSDLMVSLIHTPEISLRIREEFFADGLDWHANAAETSLILYLRPDGVFPDRIKDDPDRTNGMEFAHPVDRTSTNGVTGSPSLGTREKGARLFEMMVADLSDRVMRGCSEVPPLQSRPL